MSKCRRQQGNTSELFTSSYGGHHARHDAAARGDGAWWSQMALALAFPPAPATATPFVYVTNNGSNDVSEYDVGAGGQLVALTPPAVAAETGPLGIALSPDGTNVYVTNFSSKSISQYDVGGNGTLSPKSPPAVNTGSLSPEAVAVSPDGKSVYVTAGSDPDPSDPVQGYVLQYDVGARGALSPKSAPTVPVSTLALDVAVSPDGQSAYVTGYRLPLPCPGPCGHPLPPGYVSQYDVGARGQLSPKNPPTAPVGPPFGSLAVSPDGKSVYVPAEVELLVAQYDVGAGGALSPKSPAFVGALSDSQEGVAVSPDGKSVYVANGGPTARFQDTGSVSQYNIGVGGLLAPLAPASVAAGEYPVRLAVSLDGKSVYVANAGSDSVSQYDVGGDGHSRPRARPRCLRATSRSVWR